MKQLKLAAHLQLPLDVVTQTIAILAKRRAGKSFTMRRLAEQLHKAGQQIVIVDPKGDQWGIRSAADGKAAGLPVIILGGEHGDVPLEPTSGEVVAKLVVEERVSIVLDLSTFRKAEVARFMTDFLENLYRLKAKEAYRTPMMVVIDEADAIAPQKPQHGEERMLGAAEDIVRRGGQRGIGCILVTQRSAVLNKNVLTQAQMLVALRTIAPQDLAAMKAWIDVHGTAEQCHTLMESLPSLPIGDAWFWSPGWPTVDGIFQRVHVLPIETFDSGATPAPGTKAIEPKQVADVDLEALRRQMAATIDRAKADDPKELRKKILNLERELNLAQRLTPDKSETVVKEKPVLKDGQLSRIEGISEVAKQRIESLDKILKDFQSGLSMLTMQLHLIHGAAKDVAIGNTMSLNVSAGSKVFHSSPGLDKFVEMPRAASREHGTRVTNHSVGDPGRAAPHHAEVGNSGLRRMLIALAQRPGGLTKQQLGVRAGLSSKTGTFHTYLSKARTNDWIADNANGLLILTTYGMYALGDFTPLPTGRELLQYWLGELGGSGASRILSVLAEAYPQAITKEELGRRANLSPSTGTFHTYLSKLRSLQLIEPGANLKASEELFA